MENGARWQDHAPYSNYLVQDFAAGRSPIRCGAPFFLPMTIPFTGAASENETGQTNSNFNTEIRIIGGVSDLLAAQIQLSLPGTLPNLFSQSAAAIATLFGDPDSARPVELYGVPWRLSKGMFIQGQALNVAGEGEGTCVFVCQQPSIGVKDIPAERIGPYEVVPVDSQFTGTAGEQTSSAGVLNTLSYDFLLTSFFSDLNFATIQIIDVDGLQWMVGSNAPGVDNRCPIWGISGRGSSAIRRRFLDKAYLIPRNRMPQFNFTNDSTAPEASGQLYMCGHRLLD